MTKMEKNYHKCPIKKRPYLFEDDSSNEPVDLSVKKRCYTVETILGSPTNTSGKQTPEITLPTPNHSDDENDKENDIAGYKIPNGIEIPRKDNHHRVSSMIQPSYYMDSLIPKESMYPAYPMPILPSQMISPPISPDYDKSPIYLTSYDHTAPLLYSMRATYTLMDHPVSPAPSHLSLNSRGSVTPDSIVSSTGSIIDEPTPSCSGFSSESEPCSPQKENIPKPINKNSPPRFECSGCGKSYSTYSGMSKHQQFHCPAAEGNKEKKSFSCTNCDKVYNTIGALKMHIRTHTLPCKCEICGKAFSRPWLLQGHIRTHTGEKPFNCQFCHRAFADRSNLRAHLQTHSDVKKYSCKSCSKTFSRMSLLTKHNEGGCPGVQHDHDVPSYSL